MRWWGDHWENRALKYLRRQGLKRVTRNYLCPAGEVDLIMRDGHTLVFVEVRFRTEQAWVSAAESVTPAKQRKVARAAAHFLQHHREYAAWPCRFDVLAITQSDESGKKARPHYDWIQAAFDVPFFH